MVWSFGDSIIDYMLSVHSSKEELGSLNINPYYEDLNTEKTQWEKGI